jgi:hypothetical protein
MSDYSFQDQQNKANVKLLKSLGVTASDYREDRFYYDLQKKLEREGHIFSNEELTLALVDIKAAT